MIEKVDGELSAYQEHLKGLLERVHLMMSSPECIRSFQMVLMDNVSGKTKWSKSTHKHLMWRFNRKLTWSKYLVKGRKSKKRGKKNRRRASSTKGRCKQRWDTAHRQLVADARGLATTSRISAPAEHIRINDLQVPLRWNGVKRCYAFSFRKVPKKSITYKGTPYKSITYLSN